jgi:hypothetical protein
MVNPWRKCIRRVVWRRQVYPQQFRSGMGFPAISDQQVSGAVAAANMERGLSVILIIDELNSGVPHNWLRSASVRTRVQLAIFSV